MAKGQTPENAYPEADRLAALELASQIGMKPAARQLGLPRATLYRWRDMYPKQWTDFNLGKEHRLRTAENLEDLAARYTDAEHDALEKVEEMLTNGRLDPKELAALIKALGASRGVATAGAQRARGDNQVVEHNINFPQLEQAMQALLSSGEPPGPGEAEVVALPPGSVKDLP